MEKRQDADNLRCGFDPINYDKWSFWDVTLNQLVDRKRPA